MKPSTRARRALGAVAAATLAGVLAISGSPTDAAWADSSGEPSTYTTQNKVAPVFFVGRRASEVGLSSFDVDLPDIARDGFSIEAEVIPSAGALEIDEDVRSEMGKSWNVGAFLGYPVDTTRGRLLADWADFTPGSSRWNTNRFKIAWILAHSPLDECRGLRESAYYGCLSAYVKNTAGASFDPAYLEHNDGSSELAAAMQAAIWHLSDGLVLDTTRCKEMALQCAMYAYLVAHAEDTTRLKFDVQTISGQAGTTLGPITLDSAQIATMSATLPDGFELLYDKGDMAGAAVNSGKTEIRLRVPTNAVAGSLDLTATSVYSLPHGRLWTSTSSGAAMITTDPTTATVSTRATFTWTAAASIPDGSGDGDSGSSPPVSPADSVNNPSPPVAPPAIPPAPAPALEPTTSTPPTPPQPNPLPTPRPSQTPTTSTPTTSAPPRAPEPDPAPPPRPSPPPTAAPTPTPTEEPLVTRTFQVDRYRPKGTAQARVVARLDDDGVLRYREDRPLWSASRWQFVTVRVPAKATSAQVIEAINAKTSARIGDVRTSARLRNARVGAGITIAWELGRGATATAPWGPANRTNQVFFARS